MTTSTAMIMMTATTKMNIRKAVKKETVLTDLTKSLQNVSFAQAEPSPEFRYLVKFKKYKISIVCTTSTTATCVTQTHARASTK